MKKAIQILLFLLSVEITVSAQTQMGYVKTIGRPNQPGQLLNEVVVQAQGMFNPVISDAEGAFSINVPGKKDGDPIVFLRIQKNDYELKDKEVIGRQYVCSSKIPIIIQMVDIKQLTADKKRIEDNAYKVAEKNYQKKLKELEEQLDQDVITLEKYRQELASLEDKYEKYMSLISDMADRYARADYDNMDSIDQQINICIENGELERADSLIHSVFDPETVLERNRAAKREIQDRIVLAQSIIEKANADKEAILKDIEYAKRVANLCENLAKEYIGIEDQESAMRCLEKALSIKRIIYGEESDEVEETQQRINGLKP